MLAVDNLEWKPPWKLFDGTLYLQLVRNPGAAFGMATGMTWLLTLVAAGVVIAIFKISGRLRSRAWAVALGLVLGGALGNLTDRMLRFPGVLRGWVVDFISLFAPDGQVWPVFNVADSAICVGGVLLVLLALLGRELDGTRIPRRPER
ncbi:MAG TPA: signal peptidase II [Pseudonocardia sp.]